MTTTEADTRPLDDDLTAVEGLTTIDGTECYAIHDVDRMAPFLMSVVSDGDRWMFVSSTGALTAGRGDATNALFPYETDDRLHAAAGSIGPVTRLRVSFDGASHEWRPFATTGRAPGPRTVYKSVVGDVVVFEERNLEHELTFRYRWTTSDRFGFVRTATLVNDGARAARIELLDGLVNILPAGVDPPLHRRLSNLSNAYKRSEVVDAETRLAVFSLESPVSDKAEPEEVLRASVAWSTGLAAAVTLDAAAVGAFDAGETPDTATVVTGRPGAYLLTGSSTLDPSAATTWHIVADVRHDQPAVVALRDLLRRSPDVDTELERDARAATESLVRIMAPADALQCTADQVATAHHFSNVTYNVMRGGVPLDGYRISAADFRAFVGQRNRRVAGRHREWLAGLPETIERRELLERIAGLGDVGLTRLGLEYLPFSFSRRHGDPSRPWNTFSIRVRDEEGNPVVYYEGNWRDVFQNWEALCASFPDFLPGVVAAFVNASTVDGFNPYRITRDGIDWEVPDPDDPWANIGYWGDHQIVYLLRLLEAADRFRPGAIAGMLSERWFSYADVPYRIAAYGDLLDDPKSTITFDEAAAARAAGRVEEIGGEGKLLPGADGELHLVNLVEKLLVPALAKLSNLVPGGGIWMNTQRPEWNDANNALVGSGLSMVTLYQLRRYVDHLRSLVTNAIDDDIELSTEVADWLRAVTTVLRDSDANPATADAGGHRKLMIDRLGGAYSDYRSRVYADGLSGVATIAPEAVVELCDAATTHLDATIRTARRDDGLYHSYNLVRFAADGKSAAVEHLPEMLEGQVAVISAGVLTADEQADVVDALFASAMYRPDQQSFMLYPIRRLPSFLEKNVVPADDVEGNPLLAALLAAGEHAVVDVDADGRYRFHPDLVDHDRLGSVLDRFADDDRWSDLVAGHRDETHAAYERVFGHHGYTGRSGSMYAYEGIGSIYWHMVAKLMLAVQEAAVEAAVHDAGSAAVQRLVDGYERVRAGMGFNKTPAEHGAVPIDPYSHTPLHAGAQQPGMTGVVKEEILTRPAELGVRVESGDIVVDPLLLRTAELLETAATWSIVATDGRRAELELGPGTVGFTMCQVPIVVGPTSGEAHVDVTFADGRTERRSGSHLGTDLSAMVFGRSGDIARIDAFAAAPPV